jgi:hypothetical protein
MNNTINLTDEQFQLQHSDKCDLLIHLGSRNIAFAIIDKSQQQLKVLTDKPVHENDQHIPLIRRLDNLRESSLVLQQKFRRVKISVETPAFTFIPQELYSKDLLEQYDHFIRPEEGTELKISTIYSGGIKNITAIDSVLIKELNARFTQPLIFSSIHPFIESTLQIAKKDSSTQLFFNFDENAFEAAYYEKGKFSFYNKFEYETADEFNYFLLNIIQQLSIDLKNTALQLSGKIEHEDELVDRLEKYFDEINFAGIFHLVKVPSTIASQASLHNYFSLISLGLCE